ncbi:MAG: hypothetical protein KC561_17655, partial [Myxococcales bacterium]|nr:hypothetical protein [Myxococcales bacterium]
SGEFSVISDGDVAIVDGASVSGEITIRAFDFTLGSTASLSVSPTVVEATGSGAGETKEASGGAGGGHGGVGGDGFDTVGGVTYGDPDAPTLRGSGGGLGHRFGDVPAVGSGGMGGGLVQILARNDATIGGTIDALGGDGAAVGDACGGGGSGGSVYVSASNSITTTGAPVVSANGGTGPNCTGADLDGAGGGGGRIAMCSPTTTIDSSNFAANGGPALGIATAGAAGSITTSCASATPNAALLVSRTPFHVTDIDVPTTGVSIPVMSFRVREVSGFDGADLQTLTFTSAGDFPSVDLSLYLDNDENGVWDATDTLVDTVAGHVPGAAAAFDLSTVADIAADGELIFLLTADYGVPAGRQLDVDIISDTDLAANSLLSGDSAVVTGAPIYSGTKTTSSTPRPVVISFSPTSEANSTTFNIDVRGINFSGATDVRFNSIPVLTFSSFVENSDTDITGQVAPAAPPVNPGYYDVQVETPFGSNTTSATKFEFFAPCVVPGQLGVCAEGELVGTACVQTVFPSAEV